MQSSIVNQRRIYITQTGKKLDPVQEHNQGLTCVCLKRLHFVEAKISSTAARKVCGTFPSSGHMSRVERYRNHRYCLRVSIFCRRNQISMISE